MGIVKAIKSDSTLKNHRLVFGMDANTYEKAKPGKQQDVLDFAKDVVSHGMTSCWGDVPNPKDFIIFPKDDFKVIKTWKDNTGKKTYIEDMAFPTLEFPSDHGLLSTILEPKLNK